MSDPKVTCGTCGRFVACIQSGQGFPPDVAKRKLAKMCKAAGHVSDPSYRAGLGFTDVRGMGHTQ